MTFQHFAKIGVDVAHLPHEIPRRDLGDQHSGNVVDVGLAIIFAV
jgi:hypothetical protein